MESKMLSDILTQLGTTTVVIGVAGFFLRSWFLHQLEKLQKSNEHQLALQLESAKARWAKDVAKISVHETYLHEKRVKLIEELHELSLKAEQQLHSFFISWWAHSNKEEVEAITEIETDEFSVTKKMAYLETYIEINALVHQNSLYLSDDFVEGIRAAYQPLFDEILEILKGDIPELPEKYKDIVRAGQAPRKEVVELFRQALGVM